MLVCMMKKSTNCTVLFFCNCRTMPDLVWGHGQKVRGGFKCKYCKEEKGGGGATRFKEHLAHKGKM